MGRSPGGEVARQRKVRACHKGRQAGMVIICLRHGRPPIHPPSPHPSHPSLVNRPPRREFRGPITALSGLEGYLLLASGNRVETCTLSRWVPVPDVCPRGRRPPAEQGKRWRRRCAHALRQQLARHPPAGNVPGVANTLPHWPVHSPLPCCSTSTASHAEDGTLTTTTAWRLTRSGASWVGRERVPLCLPDKPPRLQAFCSVPCSQASAMKLPAVGPPLISPPLPPRSVLLSSPRSLLRRPHAADGDPGGEELCAAG
mgnify:CR=1 FL=1